ncbi:hypothetical protein KKF84_17140 [Myxococcota bacterium]|nr:hypothetical protein [Myxococcota bacterium]
MAVFQEVIIKQEPVSQISLPFSTDFSAEDTELLQRRIQAHMRGKLDLTVTDNRASIISVKRIGGVHRVRLHHMFMSADGRVLKALGRYIERADSKSSAILENFIENNAGMIRELPVRNKKERIYQKGTCHDLQEIYDFLNKRYFGDQIQSKITWGKPLTSPPKHHRSVKMGTYSIEERMIRIHKALDRDFVPRFFLESIIYHEMLHQQVGVDVVNGRNRYHTEDFHELERRFDHHSLAKRWERENITRLLYF